jgi:hypothetical protein
MPEDTKETPGQDQSIQIPVQDPLAAPAPKPLSPDDDPNLKLQSIIARRNKPENKEEEKKSEDKKEEKPKGDPARVSGLIGKALGFKQPEEKKEETKEEPEDGEKKTEDKKEDQAKKDEKDAESRKTIVKPKKSTPQPAAIDVSRIATAAATAAVKAISPDAKVVHGREDSKIEEALKGDDLHEYEVAKYMADLNPKFKDAPKIVLEHIKKAEAYASSWEKENKGKVFDPNDDEHDDFFSALQKPWSDHEFRNAEMEIAAERVSARNNRQSETKLKELETENARIAITPVIERTFTAAAGLLARKIGDDVHEKIVKNTFEKFAEEDPLTANALAGAIGPLQPIIEAAIQLDDPKGRFKFDPKNQVHLEWNRIMLEKESELSGTEDGNGRTMATRAEYAQMTQGQRAKHWYLTTEHLIESLVDDAADSARKYIDSEKERVKKMAIAMGFVPKDDRQASKSKSDTTKKAQEKTSDDDQSVVTKPVSPATGGSAKIDDKSTGNSSGAKTLLEKTANILFNR